MIDELLTLLSAEQKKEVADKLTRKIEDAIERYDVNLLGGRVDELFDSSFQWVFENADIDTERLGALMTDVFAQFIKEKLGVEE